ncbi:MULTISPECIES: NAD(P)H-dependent oxidoreductase [unclassified Achromobacter]|uniref:NAD(P)H-dependent oxidoreductase n=1 Tax=unclassified Achromobacter TaxID=2626865 RepID=UPI001E4DA907|nr:MULTISPECIES: NAD(P)H-dependent oxidoreductase [unclassified Achromobacter]
MTSASPRLLIVWHSRTGAAQAMAQAAAAGARDVAAWAVADEDQDAAEGAGKAAGIEAAGLEAAEPEAAGPGAAAATMPPAAVAAEAPLTLNIVMLPAAEVQAADLLQSDGFLFCAPENLGTLSGAMKECFDRCYYGVLDAEGVSPIGGRPYGLMISAGTDGTGAARQAERICTGWRLSLAAAPLIARNGAQFPAQILTPKTVGPEILEDCKELGGLLAGLLLIGG